MTYAEFHKTVRDALRGSGFVKFVCTVGSLELHPGRVNVEWSVCVTEAEPAIFFKGQNPYAVLAMLRQRLRDLSEADTLPPPAELASVGEPPPEVA